MKFYDYLKNRIFVFIILFLLIISFVLAMPTPHSIKGYVYDLDGLSQAKLETYFSFTNLNTNSVINGTIGQGSFTGRFSVSIDGVDGDNMNLFFWNKYNNISKNITLFGVVDNLKIMINDSYPNNSPIILSSPKTQIELFENYIYDVDAIDMQDDFLNYELIVFPKGMTIDSFGIIKWSPSPSDIGDNYVVVRVTDSDGLYSEQNFIINVYEKISTKNKNKNKRGGYINYEVRNNFINKIKNIIFNIKEQNLSVNSDNKNNLKNSLNELTDNNNNKSSENIKNKLIEASLNKINFNDKINYPSIVKKREQWLTGNVISKIEHLVPKKYFIFGKIISYDNPSKKSLEKSLMGFEDLFGKTQNFLSFFIFGKEFYFKIIDSPKNYNVLLSAKKNQLSGFSIVNLSSKFIKQNIVLNESSYLFFPDKSFNNMDFYFEKPYVFINSINKVVYAYIVNNEQFNDNSLIEINIDNLTKGMDVNEFNLYSYNEGNYTLLDIKKNDSYIIYETNNYEKYFVLVYSNQSVIKKTLSDSKQITKSVTELNPFIINGIAYLDNNEQVEFNTTIEFTNLNRNKTFNTSTGMGIDKGGFATIVYGLRNDSFQIRVTSKEISYIDSFVLDNDVQIELKPNN